MAVPLVCTLPFCFWILLVSLVLPACMLDSVKADAPPLAWVLTRVAAERAAGRMRGGGLDEAMKG